MVGKKNSGIYAISIHTDVDHISEAAP